MTKRAILDIGACLRADGPSTRFNPISVGGGKPILEKTQSRHSRNQTGPCRFIDTAIRNRRRSNISPHPRPLLKRGEAKDAGAPEHLKMN